ncbi:hypothetical protein NY2A_b347R [Paramecium bursaria Chlorella virus NY2A]|uniref:Uncharacterized protein b347R n=1 Tax=Paramecium bursaria Chlorella virus NY2A TaxID=46021 RepID=A7IWM2_PBCVN|nr:hypothetical protein NY2A_b347R [Paramecium bursaria Chlorella virus NY2A]ABT14746.1 hypothetical protein NY2A_b347R [Paramecium bursaria Chlorella virus NY2A]
MRRSSIYPRSSGSHHSKYSTSNASNPCFCMAFRSFVQLLLLLRCFCILSPIFCVVIPTYCFPVFRCVQM